MLFTVTRCLFRSPRRRSNGARDGMSCEAVLAKNAVPSYAKYYLDHRLEGRDRLPAVISLENQVVGYRVYVATPPERVAAHGKARQN